MSYPNTPALNGWPPKPSTIEGPGFGGGSRSDLHKLIIAARMSWRELEHLHLQGSELRVDQYYPSIEE